MGLVVIVGLRNRLIHSCHCFLLVQELRIENKQFLVLFLQRPVHTLMDSRKQLGTLVNGSHGSRSRGILSRHLPGKDLCNRG